MEIKITKMTNFGGNKYWAYDNPLDKDYNKHKITLIGFDLDRFVDEVESIWIDANQFDISVNDKNQLILELKNNEKFKFIMYK